MGECPTLEDHQFVEKDTSDGSEDLFVYDSFTPHEFQFVEVKMETEGLKPAQIEWQSELYRIKRIDCCLTRSERPIRAFTKEEILLLALTEHQFIRK